MDGRMKMSRTPDLISPQPMPFMDKMTHSIVVETSAKLNQYIKVKRRENGFILNPNSTAVDTTPLRARFIYGTSKQYPPLYSSAYTDHDVKNYLRTIGNIDPERFSTDNELEKRMCHDELRYHMRSRKPISVGNQAFAKLQLGSTRRSQSSFSGYFGRDSARDLQHSANQNNKLLVENTANILAEFTKARQKVISMSSLSRQATPTLDSRNPNTTPRQDTRVSPKDRDDRSSILQSPKTPSDRPHKPSPRSDPSHGKKEGKKESKKDPYSRALSKMRKSKLISTGILCTYKITIKTGNVNGASTNAPISMVLYGEKGHTKPFRLVDSETHEFPFQKNQTDNFTVEIDHVGKVFGIQIGHDDEELSSGWYLNTVTVEDTLLSRISEISCNAWLSSNSDDKKTKRDFPVIKKQKRDDRDPVYSDDSTHQSGYSSTATDRTITSRRSNASRKSESSFIRHKKTNKKKRESSSSAKKAKHVDSRSADEMSPPITPTIKQLPTRELSTPTKDNEDRPASPIIQRTPPKELDKKTRAGKNSRNDYEASSESIFSNESESTKPRTTQENGIYVSNNRSVSLVTSVLEKKETTETHKTYGYDSNSFEDEDYDASNLQQSDRNFDSKTQQKKSARSSASDFFD